ncbi:MAG: hypothetical protein M1831_001291 [Alyxoria varia]|nr:MAG: hypothetical protein M1831_001291 [Alyxoria varia]
MTAANVPCVPGYHGSNQDAHFLQQQAENIGFPVLLKAVKGGGGKGMRISHSGSDFLDQLQSAKSEARNSFGDDTMLVEKYIRTPRHIEVQIFADAHGNCVALGERDCSVQRRHQKIIEESPAPNLDDVVRKSLWERARAAALAVNYEGAGTVEFIFDNDTGDFYFMEMNTRLQVEHPVTEMVTGQDLVHWQLQVAEGRPLPLSQEEVEQKILNLGWGFEARIYAENPELNFIPDSGELGYLRTPHLSSDVRIDAGFIQGDEVSPYYDPMIAKLIVRGSTREEALAKLRTALESYEVAGPSTNIEFLKRLCKSADFANGEVETGYIDKHRIELFQKEPVEPEIFVQAALGILNHERRQASRSDKIAEALTTIGFGAGYQTRDFKLSELSADPNSTEEPSSAHVVLQQKSSHTFDATVDGHTFQNVRINHEPLNDTPGGSPATKLSSFFPHTRIETTIVPTIEGPVHVFHHGRHLKLQRGAPHFLAEALGKKETANSVLAPMPCKILRVDVEEGQKVSKDQVLVVIESMKMETTIRSPQDGVVEKVVHKQGDICKAGTALVEFKMPSPAS